MRPNHGWSLGLMPRTETPPPISDGRTWKALRGEHFSRSQQSRGQSLASRARLRARENEKSVLAIKLGAKAGCSLEALNFRIPSRVFLHWGCEFPGLQLSHNEPGSMASYQRYSRGNAPFSPSRITYPIETIGSEKPKLLRFMEGNRQSRLLAGSPELSNPPPGSARCRGSFLRMGPR
jgi:hypothetical protein